MRSLSDKAVYQVQPGLSRRLSVTSEHPCCSWAIELPADIRLHSKLSVVTTATLSGHKVGYASPGVFSPDLHDVKNARLKRQRPAKRGPIHQWVIPPQRQSFPGRDPVPREVINLRFITPYNSTRSGWYPSAPRKESNSQYMN